MRTYTFVTGDTITAAEMETYEKIVRLFRYEDAAWELEKYVDAHPECFYYCAGHLDPDMAHDVWEKVFADKWVLEGILRAYDRHNDNHEPTDDESTQWEHAVDDNGINIETAFREYRQAYRDQRNKRLCNQPREPYDGCVCVYKDTTMLYAQEEFDDVDSLVDISVPERILRQWFEEKLVEHYPGMAFTTWYEEEYTADDLDGFFEYCVGHEIEPITNDPKPLF